MSFLVRKKFRGQFYFYKDNIKKKGIQHRIT